MEKTPSTALRHDAKDLLAWPNFAKCPATLSCKKAAHSMFRVPECMALVQMI